jgi:hypothetical protein
MFFLAKPRLYGFLAAVRIGAALGTGWLTERCRWQMMMP